MSNKPENVDRLQGIPRTAGEMDRIRSEIGNIDSQRTLDKAQTTNAKIERCRKMAKMFESEAFQEFWNLINIELYDLSNKSVIEIKGNVNQHTRFDPFGQMAQLNTIQGGLEALESQRITMKTIEETAKMKMIDTTELEEKIKILNNQ